MFSGRSKQELHDVVQQILERAITTGPSDTDLFGTSTSVPARTDFIGADIAEQLRGPDWQTGILGKLHELKLQLIGYYTDTGQKDYGITMRAEICIEALFHLGREGDVFLKTPRRVIGSRLVSIGSEEAKFLPDGPLFDKRGKQLTLHSSGLRVEGMRRTLCEFFMELHRTGLLDCSGQDVAQDFVRPLPASSQNPEAGI